MSITTSGSGEPTFHKVIDSVLVFVYTIFAAIAISAIIGSGIQMAFADELSDAEAALSEKKESIESLITQCDENQAKIDELQAKLDTLLTQIDEAQTNKATLDEKLAQYAVLTYKSEGFELINILFAADDMKALLNGINYLNKCTDDIANKSRQQAELISTLQAEYNDASAIKDEMDILQADLDEKRTAAQAEIDELKGKVSELTIEKYQGKMGTFPTGDTSGWREGPASAYGGYGDAAIADNQRTATGAAVNETSMGVAIPMAWGNTRSYYGRKIEISYNGQSVIATINDCGGMNGGQRHLDLQPGVFKSFGYDNCNSWGVRTVKYRFL